MDDQHDTSVEDVVRRWADAERCGDPAALDALMAPGFHGIGPHGFVLDREQWSQRLEQPFDIGSLTITDLDVDALGAEPAAIVVRGRQEQEASYRGNDASGAFRVSLVLLRTDDVAEAWRVGQVQLSGPMPSVPQSAAR